MNFPKSRFVLPLLLAVGVDLETGCAEPAAPRPPAGPPPPELQIGGDDEAQGEADPAPPPAAPEPAQAPAMPTFGPPPPPEASQMAPQSQPAAAPPGPAPAGPPPGPTAASQPGPPPSAPPGVVAPPPPSSGQWIYTSQYGWLWLPYSRDYTYVNGDGGAAYEYAYYPNGGWRWLYAPWVLGWGPSPYWGRVGPRNYVWYSRPWFRVGVVHRGPVYHRRWHRR